MYSTLQQIPALPSNLLDWVTVVQALGSLLLSLLIYLVYRKIRSIQDVQTNILGKQAEIMQRQNNILSAEYLPDISGEIVTDDDHWNNVESDTSNLLHLRLINDGRGKAKNMLAMIYVYRLASDEEIGEKKPTYLPAFGTQLVGWGFATQAFTTTLRQRNPDTASEDMLLPNSKIREYYCEFEVIISRMLSDSKHLASFKELVDAADKEWENTDALGFEVLIGYTDDTKQFDYTSLCSIVDVPIDTELELNDALDRAKIINVPMSYYLPEGSDRGTPDLSDIDLDTGTGIYDRDSETLAKSRSRG